MSDLTKKARALADGATAGPWTVECDESGFETIVDRDGMYVVDMGCGGPNGVDAAFIAASRELVPALCDEVERLEAELTLARSARIDLPRRQLEEIGRLRAEVERLERERDEWKRRAQAHGCDLDKGDPDCG